MARTFEKTEQNEVGPILIAAHRAALETFHQGQGQELTPTDMVITLHGNIGQDGEYRPRLITIGQGRPINTPAFLTAMEADNARAALQVVFNAYANSVTIVYAHTITITYS